MIKNHNSIVFFFFFAVSSTGISLGVLKPCIPAWNRTYKELHGLSWSQRDGNE
jgi:hypothetical protein